MQYVSERKKKSARVTILFCLYFAIFGGTNRKDKVNKEQN